jgi:hypothetical protein
MAEKERRPFSVDLVMDGNAVAVEPWHDFLPKALSPAVRRRQKVGKDPPARPAVPNMCRGKAEPNAVATT